MRKILVIDDDPIQLELINSILSDSDYEIIEAETGESVENIIVEWEPDLILTDIIMPNRDGFETILALRKEKRKFIPVIAMSSNAEYLDMAKKLGAHAIIEKSIIPDKLTHLVNRIIQI